MNFDRARDLVVRLLRERGRATHDELLQALGGDAPLLEQVQANLVGHELADRSGDGLVYLAAPADSRSGGTAGADGAPPTTAVTSPRRVFLSYGHGEHETLAERLKADLHARGHEVWLDKCRLLPGEDWEACIERGLKWVAELPGAGRIVLLMTPRAVRRPGGYCLNEIARAVDLHLPVVPVMVVWVEAPLSIARVQWLDMQDCVPLTHCAARYGVKFARLAEALESDRLDYQGTQSRLLRLLQPLPFDADLALHLPRFTGRQWFFREFDAWLADPGASRILWLTGAPGVGKTAIACWLCSHRREVAAFHLCRHGDTLKADPRRCVMSIAYQLSSQLYEYQTRLGRLNLEELVAEANAGTLFEALIVQPLATNYPPPDQTLVVMIDGLDEATHAGQNELAAFLAAEFERTPAWMRLVITSRPDPAVTQPLQAITPRELSQKTAESRDDLRQFLSRELRPYAGGEVPETIVESVLARSEGVFLYADCICRELKQGRLTLARLADFPQGLGGVYDQFFRRQFPVTQRYEVEVAPPLDVVAAAKEPPEVMMLAAMFDWNDRQRQQLRLNLGSLFSVAAGRVRPFHASLLDWLTDPERAGPYLVSRQEGHKRLAEHGWREYRSSVAGMSGYHFAHLPAHLLAARRWNDLETLLCDPVFLHARCDRNMVFELVADLADLADLAGAARAGQPLQRISPVFFKELCGRRSERLRQQLHGALSQSWGRYEQWPAEFRVCLETSDNLDVLDFLGLTHDRERRFEQAVAVFRRCLRMIDPRDTVAYAAASIQLVLALEHDDQLEESLAILERLIAAPDARQRLGLQYWRRQYHRGIIFRRLLQYDRSVASLHQVSRRANSRGLRIAGRHQLGVLDLELGRLDKAEKKFQRCRKLRGNDPLDHRRAFEYRRLGQVYALLGRFDDARKNFQQAIDLSTFCGNFRYVVETQEDLAMFIAMPQRLLREQPASMPESRFAGTPPDPHRRYRYAFRVLSHLRHGYLAVLAPDSAEPTGELVRWDLVHEQGLWHATVMVLVADAARNVCLQQRGEDDPRRRWDVSVAGHRDVGESDVEAALREAGEELGLTLGAARLRPLFAPLQFRKEGVPEVRDGGFVTPFHYRYHRDDRNRERVSVFLVTMAEDEKRALAVGPGRDALAVQWVPLATLDGVVHAAPDQYASALKQLLHPEILAEIRRRLDQ